MSIKQIFVVDDDFDTINTISIWLRHKKYDVRSYTGSAPLFVGLEMNLPAAILLDINLGGEDGREICKEIRRRYASKIPIILFSMFYYSIKQLKDSCADDFIKKDATLHEITELLQEHINIEKE